ISIPGSWFGKRPWVGCVARRLTCSGPMEDSPDVGTEVTEVMLICPVIWFMLLMPPALVAMDTLMFMLLFLQKAPLVTTESRKTGSQRYLFPPMLPWAHPFMSEGAW
uniref:Uncharacterized protein n=1 Tax=Oryctolagus cuniculus TaxID=9986 RepID=A0A5F9C2E8_RABIT